MSDTKFTISANEGDVQRMSAKIQRNMSENNVFSKQLDKYFDGKMPANEVINVCSTPNILKLLGSTAKKVVINQSDLNNSISQGKQSSTHTEGHDISKEEIYKLSEAIRSPIMVLSGNKKNSNSVVMITELESKDKNKVFVPISLDRQNGKISRISTLYGKKNLATFLETHKQNILAVNKEKAYLLADTENQYLQSINETVVRFDNTIAYSMENVKYPNQEKISQEEKQMPDIEKDSRTNENIEAAASALRSENAHTAPLQDHALQPENAVDELRDSVAQNVACSLAIKSGLSMMSEHINALGVLDKVVSDFGLDRTATVVAAEISKSGNDLKLPADVTEWAQELVGKLPIQLTNEQKVDIDIDRLVEFAQTVMKAEAVRDSVQEVDTMDGLFEQLNEQFKRNQELASSVLTEESLKDRRAVEAMKLRNSMEHLENAAEQQSVTLPILKGLSEIQINKLNNLTQKQTELQNKNTFLENKGKRLEARAERLENTGKMLKALFPQKLPKPLQALADKMEKKAAVIREEKIPKNNRRIDKNLRRMAVNDRKIEAAQCKVDKFQNISKIIKSFTVHDSTERKQQFTQALDGLHNASLRSMQIKLDKCEVKIDKLSQKYMDAEIFKKSEIMERLKAQTEKKSNLTEKIAKLSSLEKPFAEQSDKIVDDVMKTAEAEITAQEEAPERMTMEDFADELCAACVDTVAEPPVQAKDKVNEATVEGNNQFDINEYDDPDYYEQQQISELEAKEQKQADAELKETTQTNNLEDNQMVDMKTAVKEQIAELEAEKAELLKERHEAWEENPSPSNKVYQGIQKGIYDINTSIRNLRESYGIAETADTKKPSVLDNIKDIKSEQSKEQKSAPNQGQKKARSNEAEI